MIAYAVEGTEVLARHPGNRQSVGVVARAMRVLERLLAVQDIFLGLLVPVLSEIDSSANTGMNISQSFLSRTDQGLSFDHRSISAIGAFINQQLYP